MPAEPTTPGCPAALGSCEVKFARADLKAVDKEGVFEGYASLFGKQDMGRDIVLPGAFKASLAERGARGIKLLFQHDPAEPIGVWDEIVEDRRGLFVRGRLMEEVVRGREVASLMRAGALDGLSIGFRAEKARRDARTGVRRIEKVDLWEISVVTFPMLPEARVSSVKHQLAAGELPSERDFERWLTREAGFTRSEARALLGRGYKALAVKRDAAGPSGSKSVRLAAQIRRAAALVKSSRNSR